MSGLSGKKKIISVQVTHEVRDILDQIAAERSKQRRIDGDWRKVLASDLVREALEDFLKREGYDVDISVDRGGYRERKD